METITREAVKCLLEVRGLPDTTEPIYIFVAGPSGRYSPCGGGREAGESDKATLEREVDEETGLPIHIDETPPITIEGVVTSKNTTLLARWTVYSAGVSVADFGALRPRDGEIKQVGIFTEKQYLALPEKESSALGKLAFARAHEQGLIA